MNKFKCFVMVHIALLGFVIFAFAQNDSNLNIPQGMEAITVGGSGKVIVPKGAKATKIGAQVIVEGTKEYMARKFDEMEQRFAKIEADQEDLKKQLEALQAKVNSVPQPQSQSPAQPPQVIEKSGSILIK